MFDEELLFHALNTCRVNDIMGHPIQADSHGIMLTRLRDETWHRGCPLWSKWLIYPCFTLVHLTRRVTPAWWLRADGAELLVGCGVWKIPALLCVSKNETPQAASKVMSPTGFCFETWNLVFGLLPCGLIYLYVEDSSNRRHHLRELIVVYYDREIN